MQAVTATSPTKELKKSVRKPIAHSKPQRSNHRREKYLERKVIRLRAHNRLISAKQRRKRAEVKLLNFIGELLEPKT